ncbi:hypothetical protein TNCV_906721 [Trichonephila clavipes]|nr:hypothetical protein TNCV_906721 [Trichonephila clavipes]
MRDKACCGLVKANGQGVGSWQACHEFEPSTAEDPPCRRAMHVKYIEAQTPSRSGDVEVRREGFKLRCRPRLLTMVQNYEVRRQKSSSS